MILTGKLHTYLADLNKQAQERYRLIIKQLASTEGVNEDLKRRSQRGWIRAINSIANHAEEVIQHEIICA